MLYSSLGRTGLKISQYCLGTMNFGALSSEKEARRIIDAALDIGINFLDTADVYGWRLGEGLTEQIIGRWMANKPGRRDKVIVATKVYGKMGQGPNEGGLSAYHIRRACEESLRRLATDRIDLYQMHHVERGTLWEEIWQAMELLVRQGKVNYVGSSNLAAWDIATANQVAWRHGMLGLVSEQSRYNLQTRSVELEVLPACRGYGMAFLPWSPLAGGMLAGNVGKSTGRRTNARSKSQSDKHRSQLRKYWKLCRELGEQPAIVALSWLLANPLVTAPIIGPRNVRQLLMSGRALEVTLDASAIAALQEIWPGPSGEAPEAYAW
jgi:aryl-alcohol dehydrogenase-like predicted oxidoreductase